MALIESGWTDLETAKFYIEIGKLVVALLTPVLIVSLGVWVSRLVEQFKSTLWSNQKIIEKRIAIYDELAPLLNDLLCFFTFVGSWKDITPSQIVAVKRTLDKKVHIYAPLFSADFLEKYDDLMELCFETFVGMGKNARLRTNPAAWNKSDNWNAAWNKMFSEKRNYSEPESIRKAYHELMLCFSKELGVGLETEKSEGIKKTPRKNIRLEHFETDEIDAANQLPDETENKIAVDKNSAAPQRNGKKVLVSLGKRKAKET